jgi:phosphoribosyl 1,2-cyclic phosphodiesterase
MSLFIASLNSGSNGNCYYVGNRQEAVLIDAGISCSETEKRMKKLDLSISSVRAIFISHEHSDHITGVAGISKKYQIPVYVTTATLNSMGIPILASLLRKLTPFESITIGALSILAFPKSHDAADPHSFVISGHKVNVGVFTDIGTACNNVKSYFKQCNAVFLESNYCEDMLATGSYPRFLKQRISSDNGHLSNTQALELFLNCRGKQLSHLILAHLSKNNNKAALVKELFDRHAGNTKIFVASRYKETAVYFINGTKDRSPVRTNPHPSLVQLSLF